MTAVLAVECIGHVAPRDRTPGANHGICASCELDWLLREAGLFEAAGGMFLSRPVVPVVRAGGGLSAPQQRVCQTSRCSSCAQHWDPREMWYGRCPECRAQDKPFTEPVPAAGSWEDEQWRAW